ncbi:Ras GTPase-activating-like protein [Podosphaera aphanis]|nr:Ras GTPase-activating-like protein [Podosphaera aphanis]
MGELSGFNHFEGVERVSTISNSASGSPNRSTRQSVRSLSRTPDRSLKEKVKTLHNRGQSMEVMTTPYDESVITTSTLPKSMRTNSAILSRVNSLNESSSPKKHYGIHHLHSPLSTPDLQQLQKSSTSQLRTLSKLAQNVNSDEFSILTPTQEVAGLYGRRKLQKSDVARGKSVNSLSLDIYSWEGRNWMDKQRQFLQAYEYLCHIGEAKEWIEGILQKPIPPIVQLEEALRDGVILAEIVLTVQPQRRIRIFRHPKLQYRHSDNIAIFFRFLAEVEMPDLFRFELTDLYEKKNIPKVIHCIHALSWILLRKGVIDFPIGNLLGQLEFEHHELEEMQKGLDKAGVSMPRFGNMGVDFGLEIYPQPVPEVIESDEDRVTRKLEENTANIIDLQAQARGAIHRIRLGNMMQRLWDAENYLIELQSIIRGDFSRQVAEYRISMRKFAVDLQSCARGFLIRQGQSKRQLYWKTNELEVIKLQKLIRANRIRQEIYGRRLQLLELTSGLKDLQANIRGLILRKSLVVQQRDFQKCPRTKELQANIRGSLVRSALLAQKKEVYACSGVKELQANIRGSLVRSALLAQKKEVYACSGVKELQANIRGSLVRSTLLAQKKEVHACSGVKELQANIRGLLIRNALLIQDREVKSCSEINELQAKIRGLLLRRIIDAKKKDIIACLVPVERLVAAIRGMLLRDAVRTRFRNLLHAENLLIILQAHMRAVILRNHLSYQKEQLRVEELTLTDLQSASRGNQSRKEFQLTIEKLKNNDSTIIKIQAFIRAAASRRKTNLTLNALESEKSSILRIQELSRGLILRKKVGADHEALFALATSITKFEAVARRYLRQRQINKTLKELELHNAEIAELQALSRAGILRNSIETILTELDEAEDSVTVFQSVARASLVRFNFEEKMRFYKENMDKVIKIQSFVRGRLQGEAYKSLTTGKNPPVNTVKNFVHLLNDSDFDFNEEIEFERLRKIVIQQVRQNETAEQYIDQLDIKIALLVKNKITLDEVVKHQKNFGGHPGNLLVNTSLVSGNQFDLKALNKNSRKKLESYQEMFFTLQTQPQYLARLFKRIREQGTPDKDCKRIETLMMGLFGYAQRRREEYYLLKLLARSAREEIDSASSIQEYVRGNFFWVKLLANYTRSPRDRKFLRELLGPLIQVSIIEDPALDLESDPMQIYCSAINNEELRTGQPSHRLLDIQREEAIKDSETREIFINHLRDLREISDELLHALENLLNRMPYGIRFICQQSYEALCEHFPQEPQSLLLQVVGHWLWKFYFRPALIAPETMGIVEKQLTPLQKRNLVEVAKVLSQVASGRLFGGENIYLQPLNAYVGDAIERISLIFSNIISVADAESTFDIDEFNDLYAKSKPTLYVKMADIFAIHQLIAADLPTICSNRDDMLREIVQELGSVKNNETEMLGVTSTEIQMTLNPKLHEIEDPEADVKALFMETKRCVLYIIRVQAGSNLMEILIRPITREDELKWRSVLQEEFSEGSRARGAYSDANTLVDIKSMSYKELKQTALENIMKLEQSGRISRQNYYQDILNAIALDIRTKSRRRVQRHRELEGVRLTLANLNEKAEWLESQRKSYDNYIEQAMMTLQKKGKKRFLMPFTKQYNHEKELERTGRKPKFGSFKYSARTLFDKGVLVSWNGITEREWDKVNLTIACDHVGVFSIESSKGSIQIPGATAQISMDSLLAAQFANHQYLSLFENSARLNVNLLLHLLYKKFYRTDG